MKKVVIITVIAISVLAAAVLCFPLRPDYYSSEGVLRNGIYYFSNRDVVWQYSPESGLKKVPGKFDFDEKNDAGIMYVTVEADRMRTEYGIYNAEVVSKADGESLVTASLPHDSTATALYIVTADGTPVELVSPLPELFEACYYDGNRIYAITPAFRSKIYTYRIIHEAGSISAELLEILD